MNWLQELGKLWTIDQRVIKTGTDDWWQARRGRLTASGAPHTIAPFKARGINTLMQKLRDQMTPGWVKTELDLDGMNWGNQWELPAIRHVEFKLGADMVEPGMLFHPRFPFCSATPDGVIDGHISVQIKCPHNAKIHLDNLYNQKILRLGPRGGREKYWYQMQWEAWVSGCDEMFFASFDPQQPSPTKLGLTPVPIDGAMLDTFERNVLRFKDLFESGQQLGEGNVSLLEVPT